MADDANDRGGAAAANGGATEPKLTRKEAVRRAMQEIGEDAKLADLQAVIRDRFHIAIGTNHISTERGKIRKEAQPKARPAAKKAAPKKRTAPNQAAAPAPAAAPTAPAAEAVPAGGYGLEDIQAAKQLLGRLGADRPGA